MNRRGARRAATHKDLSGFGSTNGQLRFQRRGQTLGIPRRYRVQHEPFDVHAHR
jgi:hypothetical protein